MAHSPLYFIREFVEKCLIIKSVEQKNIDCLIWFEPLTFQTASESIIYWATKYETCVNLSHLLGSCLIRVLYSVRIRSVESLLHGVNNKLPMQ